MDIQSLLQAVSTVGFPIVAYAGLFYQNSKLTTVLGEISTNLALIESRLSTVENQLIDEKKGEK